MTTDTKYMKIRKTYAFIIMRHFNLYNSIPSHLKVQKLAYYAFAKMMMADIENFEIKFEAWENGPVNREIYGSIRRAYNSDVKAYATNYLKTDNDIEGFYIQNKDLCDAINYVLEMMGKIPDNTLSIMSHDDIIIEGDTPWQEAYNTEDKVISTEIISKYYTLEWWNKLEEILK